jgi:hypothetical protein
METEKIECVSMQMTLCGEVLKKVKEKQNEHYQQTGQKCSKRLAIFKLILAK